MLGVSFRHTSPRTTRYKSARSCGCLSTSAIISGPTRALPAATCGPETAISLTDEVGNRLRVGSRHYVGEQFLGRFEGGLDSWQVVGEAITNHGSHQFYQDQLPIFGHVGPGFLTSYHPEEGAANRQGAFTDVHGLGWPLSCLADWRWIGGAQLSGSVLLADGKEIVVWQWAR